MQKKEFITKYNGNYYQYRPSTFERDLQSVIDAEKEGSHTHTTTPLDALCIEVTRHYNECLLRGQWERIPNIPDLSEMLRPIYYHLASKYEVAMKGELFEVDLAKLEELQLVKYLREQLHNLNVKHVALINRLIGKDDVIEGLNELISGMGKSRFNAVSSLPERVMMALDDYLNAGSKEARTLAADNAKAIYKEYYGVDYVNRKDRKA